jgi:vesicle transport through interaction with t-SNAREs 1
MDLEARSLQPSVRAGLLVKLREYKSDLNNLKSELKRISAVGPKPGAREDLLESGMSDTLVVNYTTSLLSPTFFLLLLI